MKESASYRMFQIFNGFIMALVVVMTLYPFLYLVAQSFSSEAAVYAGKVTVFPVDFTDQTYRAVLSRPEFFKYYGNTILYAIVGTVISVAATAVMSYPLSKDRLRLNKFFIPFVLFTMYFGGGLIPNYILVAKTLHMRDTIWAIIIPGAISAFNVILMKTFFASLPNELEEAAKVDGLGVYRIFLRITLPLSKPILATMVLFSMVSIWNNWFGPSLYLESKDKWPVALYLRQIIDSAINPTEAGLSSDATAQIAATIKSTAMVLTSLPIICLYPFVQKYFVQGMMIGSVKG
ncbi:putative aldouronate transport system permease protein [Paenibacillus sp. V4I3]|uniref:carbohydrate ABC transporter permease n=1 Tax=unclassified Paenibacillus TaxID=185978 RepID=UPI00277F7DA2|nr:MULTISPECIES: carbohydrate ABC transporter permease [unclassified Paenibacillus]MDQ0875759.1 putative aldouronate transport system permease protein [Paenibacillus sp. V4I3]MDQ0888170.1 putative aldouronate transport system permease protein [Paenibacillus sp. V4I9]